MSDQLFEAVLQLRTRQASLLLERSPGLIDARQGPGNSERTPLLALAATTHKTGTGNKATSDKELEMARLLVARGAAVDARDSDGRSALLLACERGKRDLAIFLLDRASAEMSIQDRVDGRNALMAAVVKGDKQLLSDLLDRVPPSDQLVLLQRDFNGKSLWQLCKESDRKDCLRTLTRHVLMLRQSQSQNNSNDSDTNHAEQLQMDFKGMSLSHHHSQEDIEHQDSSASSDEMTVVNNGANMTATATTFPAMDRDATSVISSGGSKHEREKWARETRRWFGRADSLSNLSNTGDQQTQTQPRHVTTLAH